MMKDLLTLCASILIALSANGQSLPARAAAPLYTHLCEINQQWLKMAAPPDAALLESASFVSDEHRIQRHLQLVEARLREQTPTSLTAGQQANRAQLLDTLHAYWQAGQFPKNTRHPHRQPYFVDDYKTACAVGYLLLSSGERELVGRIRHTHNYSYLHELLPIYPELGQWAAAHGFAADELAWIQPGYQRFDYAARPVGQNQGVAGQVNAMASTADWLYYGGQFSAVAGFSAANVAAYDGEDTWRALPGLNGEVHSLSAVPGTEQLMATGSFAFEDVVESVQVAHWDGQAWHPLPGSFSGELRGVRCTEQHCYFYGSFEHEQGQGLVAYRLETGEWQPFWPGWELTGEVLSVDIAGDTLLAGGQFVLRQEDDTLAQQIIMLDLATAMLLEVSHHQTFIPNWPIRINRVMAAILSPARPGECIVWAEVEELQETYPYFGLYWQDGNDNWYWWFQGINTDAWSAESGVYGTLSSPGLFYGYFEASWGNQLMMGLMPGLGYFIGSVAAGDGPVRAAAEFQGELFIAGDFSEIEGQPLNSLARGKLDLVSPVEEVPAAPAMHVRAHGRQLWLEELPTGQAGHIELFDLYGRPVWQRQLPGLESAATLELDRRLPNGVYAYRLSFGRAMAAGKLALFVHE